MKRKKTDKAEESDKAKREFERLKDLTRRVVSVPRETIERRERAYRERRAKR